MITKTIALTLHHGQTLYHGIQKNADGSPLRARVNGMVTTWKRQPDRFSIPMKYGMYDCFRMEPNGVNRIVDAKNWYLTEEEAQAQSNPALLPEDTVACGLCGTQTIMKGTQRCDRCSA